MITGPAASSAASTTFLSWCTSQGITTPCQISGFNSTYRYATSLYRDIEPNEDVIRVPLSTCIVGDDRQSLAERLLYEKSQGSKSIFAPYINVLPKSVEEDADSVLACMPRFWSKERRESVWDGGWLDQRLERESEENAKSKEINLWALAIATSRANFLPDFRYSLTPMLDMFNHDCTATTRASVVLANKDTHNDSENDASDQEVKEEILSLRVNRHYKAGEEVFISYGDLTNLDTLCDYGFVDTHNPKNVESVAVRMLRYPTTYATIDSNGQIDGGSIASLRQLFANDVEVEDAQARLYDEQENGDSKRTGTTMALFSRPISDRNEEEVFSLLASVLDGDIDEARAAAQEAALPHVKDELVVDYLTARANHLEKGLKVISKKYPEFGY